MKTKFVDGLALHNAKDHDPETSWVSDHDLRKIEWKYVQLLRFTGRFFDISFLMTYLERLKSYFTITIWFKKPLRIYNILQQIFNSNF